MKIIDKDYLDKKQISIDHGKCTKCNKELILHKKATPFRLVLINHKIFNHIKEKLYCEECTVFDDYLLFLHVLNLYYTTNLKIYYINLKNIYIYYKAHISSVCYQNSSNNSHKYSFNFL